MNLEHYKKSIHQEIKQVIKDRGWTQTRVNQEINRLNNTNLQMKNLSKKLREGTISYAEIKQILDIIGVEIKIVEKRDNN